MAPDDSGSSGSGQSPLFATTHWSVVLQAGDSHSPNAEAALEQLCRTYWYPLYAFARRNGFTPEDAEDVTQGFFAHFLGRRDLKRVDREKGRFRTFLLSSFKNFQTSEWRKGQAIKRGGNQDFLSLDALAAEGRYAEEPLDGMSPDALFERKWALSVLSQALARWEGEYRGSDPFLANELKTCLSEGETSMNYDVLAAKSGRALGTIKSDISRARRDYEKCIRAVVLETVEKPGDVNEELRYLLKVLGG